MKKLIGILNLLLCLELIVGPFAPQFSFLIPQDSYAQETSCPSGFQYDTTLNRCITSEQTATIMNAVSNCQPDDKACYKTNAEQAMQEAEEEGKVKKAAEQKSGLINTGMKAVALAVPLVVGTASLWTARRGNARCGSMSRYLLLGAGAGVFVGDWWANRAHKKRLAENKKEWEGIEKGEKGSTSSNNANAKVKATEVQSEAFEMLARNEDSMASAAKFKAGVYGIGAAAFAASAYMAYREHTELKTLEATRNRLLEIYTPLPVYPPNPKVTAYNNYQNAAREYQTKYHKYHCKEAKPDDEIEAPDANAVDPNAAPANTTGSTGSTGTTTGGTTGTTTGGTTGTTTGGTTGTTTGGTTGTTTGGTTGTTTGGTTGTTTGKFQVSPYEFLPFENYLLLIKDDKIAQTQIKNISGAQDFASIITLHEDFEKTLATKSSPTIDSYEQNKKFFEGTEVNDVPEVLLMAKSFSIKFFQEFYPISTAHATDENVENGQLGDARNEAVRPANQGVDTGALGQARGIANFLNAPMGRAVIGGVLAGWSVIMTMHAMKQAKVSKARAEYLREIKDTFNDATGAIGGCSPEDRSNSSKPNCYCYTANGQRSSERANSDICTRLFTGKGPSTIAGTYTGDYSTQKVCVSASGGVDETCACRSNNSCLKSVPNNISGFDPGSLSVMNAGMSPMDQLTSGRLAAGSVNGSAAVGNAMRILDANRKLAAKTPGTEKERAKIGKEVENSLIAAAAGMSSPTFGNSTGSSLPTNMSPNQAAAALQTEFEKAETPINSVGGGTTFPQIGSQSEPALEFGMTPGQLAAQETELSQVMGQNIDYGQNDINTGSTTNIFKVLSNRYQRSGMRRLFDEEGKTKADKASSDDISK